MATAEEYDCWFHVPHPSESVPTREKRMNTYTVTAREINTVTFYGVEAECEEDAINRVEWGEVEQDARDFEELQNIEVTDVEYGEREYVADLTLTIHSRGVKDDDVRDLLWNLLARIDGTVERPDEGEIEAIGFNIVNLKER